MPELHAENGLRVTFEYDSRSNENVFCFVLFSSHICGERKKTHVII